MYESRYKISFTLMLYTDAVFFFTMYVCTCTLRLIMYLGHVYRETRTELTREIRTSARASHWGETARDHRHVIIKQPCQIHHPRARRGMQSDISYSSHRKSKYERWLRQTLAHAVHSVVTRPFIASTYPNEKMSQNAQNGSYLKSFSRCRSITEARM